eukprot:9468389-Pyramimonas_sp.AAC.2
MATASDALLSPHKHTDAGRTNIDPSTASVPSIMRQPMARLVISASAVDRAGCACLIDLQSTKHSHTYVATPD